MADWASGNGHRDPPRGTGLRRSLILLAVLLVGLPLAFVVRELTDSGWRPTASPTVLAAEDVIYVPDARLFLVHGDPPLALSAESPHQGELLRYCPSSETFVSLAHGERFDRTGRYVDGPAPRGMDRVGVRVHRGAVEINLLQVVQGPPRTEAGGPVQGVRCDETSATSATPGFLEGPAP